MTHICVGNLTIIGSDNGLAPGRRQAIIWTNAGILLIGPLGANFSEIVIKIITFSFKKMGSKVSSEKRRPSCLGLNVLSPSYIQPLAHKTDCRVSMETKQIRHINRTLEFTKFNMAISNCHEWKVYRSREVSTFYCDYNRKYTAKILCRLSKYRQISNIKRTLVSN